MTHMNPKKHLLCTMYKIIFKEILPVGVGYAAHADRINTYSSRRKTLGYTYEDYPHLKLQPDEAAALPEYDFKIKEGSFHNWINGISSPKYLIIINSILEYLIDTCNDKGKYNLLKERVLEILRSDEFQQYTDGLITDSINTWIIQIEQNDSNALLKATKMILYLLKNKLKFLPYLCNGRPDEIISEPETEFMEMAFPKENSLESKDKKQEKVNKYHRLKYAVPALLLLIILISSIIYSIRQPESHPKTMVVTSADMPKKNSGLLVADKLADYAADALSSTPVPGYVSDAPSPTPASAYRADAPSSVPAAKSISKNNSVLSSSDTLDSKQEELPPVSALVLSAPDITVSNGSGCLLPVSDIQIQWTPIDLADSYAIIVTDTDIWEKIYKKAKITDNSILLEKSLFKVGGNYRIYVHSVKEGEYSAPGYIDISFEKLAPPEITSPEFTAPLPLSDITIQWEPVDTATSYTVVVTDTTTWSKVFWKTDITSTSILLEEDLFKIGGNYRIYIHSAMGNAESAPDYIDLTIMPLLSPEITAPADGSALPLSDVCVQWEPAAAADSYTIVVTDTGSWTKIFTKTDIADNSIVLEKGLFLPGESYRIYLHSDLDTMESVPNYIDITIAK